MTAVGSLDKLASLADLMVDLDEEEGGSSNEIDLQLHAFDIQLQSLVKSGITPASMKELKGIKEDIEELCNDDPELEILYFAELKEMQAKFRDVEVLRLNHFAKKTIENLESFSLHASYVVSSSYSVPVSFKKSFLEKLPSSFNAKIHAQIEKEWEGVQKEIEAVPLKQKATIKRGIDYQAAKTIKDIEALCKEAQTILIKAAPKRKELSDYNHTRPGQTAQKKQKAAPSS